MSEPKSLEHLLWIASMDPEYAQWAVKRYKNLYPELQAKFDAAMREMNEANLRDAIRQDQ